jgi:hypothetical protein
MTDFNRLAPSTENIREQSVADAVRRFVEAAHTLSRAVVETRENVKGPSPEVVGPPGANVSGWANDLIGACNSAADHCERAMAALAQTRETLGL